MPVLKTAIQELSGEELEKLIIFGKTEAYSILLRLADKEKYKRYERDFLSAQSMDEISMLRGVNIGIDFIMDSVSRAKEELKARGVDIDTQE